MMIRLTLRGCSRCAAGAFADITGIGSSPAYTAASIVHAATQTAEALAPNTIATIYGTNLAFSTTASVASDISAGTLPQSLDGVTVIVDSILANLFYVSPGQINFLVPYNLTPEPLRLGVAPGYRRAGRQNTAEQYRPRAVSVERESRHCGTFEWKPGVGNFPGESQ